jgi:tRNA threonylcarbamoyladenosine biosynthesis protein TsaB
MLLALDTSTRLAGIALYSEKDGLVAEYCWHSANRHTVELMPRVALMLSQAGVASRDLKSVAVALGPGSFTGLRVALAAARPGAAEDCAGRTTLDRSPPACGGPPVIAVVQAGQAGFVGRHAHGPAADRYLLTGWRRSLHWQRRSRPMQIAGACARRPSSWPGPGCSATAGPRDPPAWLLIEIG